MKTYITWLSFFLLVFTLADLSGKTCARAVVADSITSQMIKSEFQEDSTRISKVTTDLHHHHDLYLVFVLPVEPIRDHYQFGSGIEECQLLINEGFIANNVVFIQPEYIRMPWYGNHPTKREIWQQEYTLEVIQKMKALYEPEFAIVKVYLLGFSKSGWGSMHLLLQAPGLIDGIFIWDAPLAAAWNETWGMQEVFETSDHYEQHYDLMRLEVHDLEPLKNKLIAVGGYDLFALASTAFLHRLDQAGVSYIHDDNLIYSHQWDKRWIYGLLHFHDKLIIK